MGVSVCLCLCARVCVRTSRALTFRKAEGRLSAAFNFCAVYCYQCKSISQKNSQVLLNG